MNISIIGCGYVGLVTGACLSQVGNNVLCYDINTQKIKSLKKNNVDIFEPNLENIIENSQSSNKIRFTSSMKEAIKHGEIIFICVGTPPKKSGDADLSNVFEVAKQIGKNIDNYKIITTKSTVPTGTTKKINNIILKELKARKKKLDYVVASNPEFLKEGSAVIDFNKPDRIIIGTNDLVAKKKFLSLYAPFNRNHHKIFFMSPESAELTKYAANTMLASRITFINEIANIADLVGADVEDVRKGIGSDPRIGYNFIYPGCGFGGSCLPKDIKALHHIAKKKKYDAKFIKNIDIVNENQKLIIFKKINKFYKNKLKGRTFGVWGLSFKPNTNDVREAPSRILIDRLLNKEAKIIAYDPIANSDFKKIYKSEKNLKLVDNMYSAVKNTDALIINTEWQEFKSPDFDMLKAKLKEPVIFDGRNIYNPESIYNRGYKYFCIGRNYLIK